MPGLEHYLRTEGAIVLGVQLVWEVVYTAASSYLLGASLTPALDGGTAAFLMLRFARNSAMWYYYKMTKAFWINYLYYTSYTTYEFLRLVSWTFTVTIVHELLGGGRTNGDGWLPFPFEACSWTAHGIANWKAQDPDGYATAGSPEAGDFVHPRHRLYWGWKRPPMWHLILSMEVFCTVSNPAITHEYQNYLGKLNAGLPKLAAKLIAGAKAVTSKTFARGYKIDAAANVCGDYKIFDVGAGLADRLHQAMEGGSLFVGVNVDVALVDELMCVICEHVSRGGEPITVDDCVCMHLNTGTAGPYIPVLHWDVEYGLFPEADGFNVWMLTSSDNAEGTEGNVYIARSPKITGDDELPEWIAFTGEAKAGEAKEGEDKPRPAVVRRLHDLSFPERQTAAYETVEELDMTFDYVGAKPGECVIWSKRTLHMSDPRPLLESRTLKRKVIQIRVVLKPKDKRQQTLVFNPKHPSSYLLSGWASLRDMATEIGGKCHVPIPATYQLLQPFFNPAKASSYNAKAMKAKAG